jgi:hypothetical protein
MLKFYRPTYYVLLLSRNFIIELDIAYQSFNYVIYNNNGWVPYYINKELRYHEFDTSSYILACKDLNIK